ncbi:MAG: thiamine pyrophosphate-dependent dehydrogenase E1 component subunit alpha [Alphaproteobacteria bacterium]|nr:thiamine pyrophosphate-dependent dehydrogenase E1 component subunit alpha [Alphaproteobacteria bacterium]
MTGNTAEARRNDAHVARLLDMYRTMARIRAFEERAEQGSRDGLVKGAVHLSIGQEAVAAGVCRNLEQSDFITSTHRGHGHTIAKGADVGAMMCELFGRAGGTCEGKGGSMHIADFNVGMLGANGVVGAGIPIAVGAAHGIRLEAEAAGRPDPRVVVCFFGDGAINRGPFLEGLNWAQVYKLPILFVCEDNAWSATTFTRALSAGPGPAARAEALGIPATTVDGNDVEAVDRIAGTLVAKVRGGGPAFLLATTYRLKGHTAADAGAYRKAEEVAAHLARDPLPRTAERLKALGVEAGVVDAVVRDAAAELDDAYARAKAAPWPDDGLAFTDVLDVGAGTWR